MAALPLTQLLVGVLPYLGGVAALIGAWFTGTAIGTVIHDQLNRYASMTANEKDEALRFIQAKAIFGLESDAIRILAEAEGQNVSNITATVNQAVKVELDKLEIPTYLPTFATQQAAIDFWGENYNYYLQGLQTDAYFNAITAWCNAEITRIAMSAVTAPTPLYQAGQVLQTSDGKQYRIGTVFPGPPIVYQVVFLATGVTLNLSEAALIASGAKVVSGPVAPTVPVPVAPVPTATKYQVGQTISFTFMEATGSWLILSVDTTQAEPVYHIRGVVSQATTNVSESFLAQVNATVVAAAPPGTVAGYEAQIAVLQAQVLALNGQVATLTNDLSIALTTLSAQGRIVTVQGPDVNVQAGDITVQAAPAPNVQVGNVVDTSSIASMLGLLPMLGVQALSGISALGFNNMGEGMRHGARKCDITTMLGFAKNLAMGLAIPTFGFTLLQNNPWSKQIDSVVTQIIEPLIDPRFMAGEVSPDSAMVTAGARLVQAAEFGIGAHYLALAGELMNPEKQMGMGFLAAMLADFADFKRVANATIGTIESVTLSTPMRQYANRKYRPNIPGMGDLEEMYAKKEIPFSASSGTLGLKQALALWGYSDEWANVYKEHLWRDPRLGEIIRIGQFFNPLLVEKTRYADAATREWMVKAGVGAYAALEGDWYYAWRAAKGGYDPRDVPVLVETAKRATARREQTLFLDGVTRLARDGFITEVRSRELILKAWEFSNPIEARLSAIELQKEYKVLSDTRSVLLLSMVKGLITRDEAREQLTGLGLTGERVELEVLKATLGMIPGMRLEISRPEEVLEEAGMEAE